MLGRDIRREVILLPLCAIIYYALWFIFERLENAVLFFCL